MNDAVTSLLTEHFSYTPLSLIDDIINSINNLIYQAISSLETGLLNTPPERLGFGHANNNASSSTIPDTDADGNIDYPEARLEIENGLHQLETLFESSVDRSFDKLEIYVLRNIFTVPEDLVNHMKLAHYENLSFNQDANVPTPESINLQRRKLRETRKLQQALRNECSQNDAVIAQLRAILSAAQDKPTPTTVDNKNSNANLPNLSFLTSHPTATTLRVGQNNSLTTNTDFVLSQLPALHAVTEKLRAKLSSLPSTTTPAADSNNKRNERRDYIDSRIKIHLERSGEPALGDGNTVIAGRKISSAEAQALEAVGNILNEGK